MSLRVEIGDVAERPVLSLTGSIDVATVPTLQNAIGRLLVEHPGRTIAVDLDGVESVDDVGLGILLGAAGRARANDGDIVIVCTDASLRERFALTGLDRAIRITASLAE